MTEIKVVPKKVIAYADYSTANRYDNKAVAIYTVSALIPH